MAPPAVAELILVRHGETAWNTAGRFTTRTDVPLSERGRRQARMAAAALASVQIERLLTSPLGRAAETAAEIASAQHRPPAVTVDPRLVEIDAGPFEGLTTAEIAAGRLRDAYRAWHTDTDPSFPDGAETLHQATARGGAFVDDVSRLPGLTVAVTHGSLARVIVTAIVLGADPALHRRLWLDNARLVVLRWYDGRPRLLGFNAATVGDTEAEHGRGT